MKRGCLLLVFAMFLTVGLAKANLVLNGDFEDPDITGTKVLSPLSPWLTARSDNQAHLDDKGTEATVPGPTDNQVVRLIQAYQTGRLRQFLDHNWTATDVYTLTFNASEPWWQPGEDIQNAVQVTLYDTGVEGWDTLWVTTVDLDGTHDGVSTGDWTAAQTFSFTIDASTFTTGVEGGQLLLEFKGVENVTQLDNVSMVVPEPATLVLLALGTLAGQRKRR